MGATWWDSTVSDRIYTAIHTRQPSSGSTNKFQLTKRELEVLTLITQGKTNQQIAEMLFISPGTARVHVHAILQKLDVSDRTQAAIMAIEQNLISKVDRFNDL